MHTTKRWMLQKGNFTTHRMVQYNGSLQDQRPIRVNLLMSITVSKKLSNLIISTHNRLKEQIGIFSEIEL